jgi:archaellum component FlaF (FlaF/FlaG flagellin family)
MGRETNKVKDANFRWVRSALSASVDVIELQTETDSNSHRTTVNITYVRGLLAK